MAKQGMKRPDYTKNRSRNEQPHVPELQGKAKNGKEKANPIVSGTGGANQKVFHDRPQLKSYKHLDNELAWDNLENDLDMTFADLQDMQ